MGRWLWRATLVAAAVLLLGGFVALAAQNSVPTTTVVDSTSGVSVQQLAPRDCSGMALTSVVVGSGSFNAGGARQVLMLGSPGADVIRGSSGADCIVGGGGVDVCQGGGGADVLVDCP